MVATPVAPALSRTVTVSVCGPFGVSVGGGAGRRVGARGPVSGWVGRGAPREGVLGIVGGLAGGAREGGGVRGAVGGGGGEPPPFCTMTFTEAVPVAPAASRTVTV